ncbi:alpha-ketoglutarate-dependent dioxygenase AlkB [Danxiaibacter flavus]|uniref:Alpha-ketoglutarate-dependent dioxygenase AlkB n=1 Tax=Danxiaibacter flavus TaxID=3049108 RepID=A0ABV3ZM94_9BACT|nr:alpha-ketoglutarate-dependent dioxygenase AlkB [Chitinophagaceae bacterium DXS]
MKLFDDIALFDEGKKRFKDFMLPDEELKLWEQFFGKTESDKYFSTLLTNTPWQQRTRKMYDRMVLDPRLTAYYGGSKGLAWTSDLLDIKARVEQECGITFERVLLNYYRDGNDSVAWHSDTLPADGKHHAIASVTFGETRLFKVRHKTRKDLKQLDIPLTHGSFLLMGETMQDHYEHHVPKTSRNIGARINLTFRISELVKDVYFVR